MKSTKRELELENERLQKENLLLIDRCANLEIDLTQRIEALEGTPKSRIDEYRGNHYQ